MAPIAISVTVVVAYTMRPREVAAPPEKIERLDPSATVRNARWRCHSDEGDSATCASSSNGNNQQDGENKLHGVRSRRDREGQSYSVIGKEAFIGQQNSSFDVRGDIKLETSDR